MECGESARGWRLMLVMLLTLGATRAARPGAPAASPAPETLTMNVGDVAFEFVRVPAGRFQMGSASGDRDERPAREVAITGAFYLGRTEVTVRQFRAFAEATGYQTDAERAGWAHTCPLPGLHPHQRGLDWRHPGFQQQEDHPAVVLSWNDATAFCRRLSEQTGRAVRLPTEAEWEYAARAGRGSDGLASGHDAAWNEDNAGDGTRPAAGWPANPWGLYDMQGNASEWCLDVWRPDYSGGAPDGGPMMSDPTIPREAWRHVLRGGDWASPVDHLRFGRRDRGVASFATPATGFRLACDPQGAGGGSGAHADSSTRAPVHPISSRGPVMAGETKDPACGLNAVPAHNGACRQSTLATDSRTGRTILATHGVQFDFARIPAGEFLMGTEEGSIEKPVHRVRIGYDFEMATTEVTVAQFRAFVEATGYLTDGEKAGVGGARPGDQNWQAEPDVSWQDTGYPQSDQHAVGFISWYDAMTFCHWLSTQTGQEIRLPSESEWEYACRAGTSGAYAGPVNAMGWHRHNSGGRTHPVAQKQPNAWGLYDMHGNVWEWCLDFFTTSYEGAPADGRPRWDLRPASDVVSRGGSFANPPGWLGSAIRMGSFPDCSHYNNGFRLVRVPGSASLGSRRSSLEAEDGRESTRTTIEEREAHAVSRTSSPRAKGATPSARVHLVPVEVELPTPVFVGTREDIRAPRTKPVQTEPGPPFLAPAGTKNVALGKPVTASDEEPIIGELEMVTDGDKEAADGSYVELGPFLQHVTIDLEGEHEIYGIRLWHYHKLPRVYYDVIVQVSRDPDFITGVTTIFNNDMDNSAGLGLGTDRHYVDTSFGEIFDARGLPGRYVRLYSNGSTGGDANHYIEVEVYGRPVDHAGS